MIRANLKNAEVIWPPTKKTPKNCKVCRLATKAVLELKDAPYEEIPFEEILIKMQQITLKEGSVERPIHNI